MPLHPHPDGLTDEPFEPREEFGFATNQLVARHRIRVGRQTGPAALIADGLHTLTDGFTSLAVVAGAAGVQLRFPLVYPVGLLITVAILFVLRGAAIDNYRRLMDGVDPDLVAAAERTLASTPNVIGVQNVRRWLGHRIRAQVGIIVDADPRPRRRARHLHRRQPPSAAPGSKVDRGDCARQPRRPDRRTRRARPQPERRHA